MLPLHNCRIKRYPDGSADVVAASAPFGGGEIRRVPSTVEDLPALPEPSFDESNIFDRERRARAEEAAYAVQERCGIEYDGWDDEAAARTRAASLDRAKRRARVAVRDLGLCNDFRFFVTLTLDQAKIDRYDAREVIRHLNHWLSNNVRRKGLAYVLVPEYHKDGAIHFHGFFNDALEAVDSGHKDRGGHTVYNLPGWGWGFSTAIELYGERAAAVAYTCKYISKAQEKIGGRWYYSGGDLRRPDVEWLDVDYQLFVHEANGDTFTIDGLRGVQFAHVRTARTDVSCETARNGQSGTPETGSLEPDFSREDTRELAGRVCAAPLPGSGRHKILGGSDALPVGEKVDVSLYAEGPTPSQNARPKFSKQGTG